MENKIGCGLRELCPVYRNQELYRDSKFISPDFFPLACDVSRPNDFKEGYCPVYDIKHKELRGLLEKALKDLEKVNRGFKGMTSSIKSISEKIQRMTTRYQEATERLARR